MINNINDLGVPILRVTKTNLVHSFTAFSGFFAPPCKAEGRRQKAEATYWFCFSMLPTYVVECSNYIIFYHALGKVGYVPYGRNLHFPKQDRTKELCLSVYHSKCSNKRSAVGHQSSYCSMNTKGYITMTYIHSISELSIAQATQSSQ